jgi:hypothetical protein
VRRHHHAQACFGAAHAYTLRKTGDAEDLLEAVVVRMLGEHAPGSRLGDRGALFGTRPRADLRDQIVFVVEHADLLDLDEVVAEVRRGRVSSAGGSCSPRTVTHMSKLRA